MTSTDVEPQCLTSDYACNDDFKGEREIKFK